MPAEDLWILLEGEVELSRRLGADTVVIATMCNPGQWAGGFTAWGDDSDAGGYRATGTALTDVRFFRLPSVELARLMEQWFPFGKHMATGIFQTVRSIDALVRQRGSLIALGTMAAGLAHELNNPAAAARRAVDSLRTAGDRMVGALVVMADQEITADQYRALETLRVELVAGEPSALTPVERARREDAVGDHLASLDVGDAWRLAPVLVAAGFDTDGVRRVGELVGAAALAGAVQWIASTAEARQLLDELADATERISNLVGAVEPFFTTKDVGQGTGLGPDISRRIVVEHHHGSIDFRTSPDGTTATVSLPVN